jgi:hypothetical protein
MLLNTASSSVLAVAGGLLFVAPTLAVAAGQQGVTPARQGQMIARRQIANEQKDKPAGCDLPRAEFTCNKDVVSEL